MTRRLKIIIALGIAIIAVTAWCYSHSLWRPEESIRASLLELTPLGTDKAAARTLAEKRGWVDPNYKEQSYIRIKASGDCAVTVVGGLLGRYSFPRRIVVVANWEFDASNHLVDVLVIKASDTD